MIKHKEFIREKIILAAMKVFLKTLRCMSMYAIGIMEKSIREYFGSEKRKH